MSWRDEVLDEARSLGDWYVSNAVRAHGKATWLQRYTPDDPRNTPTMPQMRSMDAPLYGGTSGVALFLARLAQRTQHPEYGDVAAEAALHAANLALAGLRSRDTPALERFGFYTGSLGVAWAALEVGAAVRSPQLTNRGKDIVRALAKTRDADAVQDVMAGRAGAIPALLRLEAMGVEGARELAVDCGRRLVEQAVWDGEACSWNHASNPPAWHRPLTGFSHGTTGVAWALAHLHAATGDEAFQRAALGGFAYDRRHYSPAEANWPDFRRAPTEHGPSFMCMWCHGAPGIAMARAQAARLLSEPLLAQEAEAGLGTARRRVAEMLQDAGMNFQLCHGVAGNAESVALAQRLLGRGEEADGLLATVARHGVARYGHAARERWESGFVTWPTGTPSSPERSLLRGTAGVGYFLLQSLAPQEPTLLMPGASGPLAA